ncbi:MAG TPA: hypothetical protein VHF00_00115 [Acidimicrobiales bacterium]|jgi:hypothetical protein|nr:hypothetical protein [Acidimicrobiales bacterium]
MLIIECPRHDARVLLGLDSIEALVSTPEGTEVHWRCTCGERGVWVPRALSVRATTTSSG